MFYAAPEIHLAARRIRICRRFYLLFFWAGRSLRRGRRLRSLYGLRGLYRLRRIRSLRLRLRRDWRLRGRRGRWLKQIGLNRLYRAV